MAKEMTRAELRTKLEKAHALCEQRGEEIVELNKKLANVQRTLTMKTSEVENLKKRIESMATQLTKQDEVRLHDEENYRNLQKENEQLEKSNNQFAKMYKEELEKKDQFAYEAMKWRKRVEYLMEGGIFRFLREKYRYCRRSKGEQNGESYDDQKGS